MKDELQAALHGKVASLLDVIKSKDDENALLESKLATYERHLQQTAGTSQLKNDYCLLLVSSASCALACEPALKAQLVLLRFPKISVVR